MSLQKYDELKYIYQMSLRNFIQTQDGFRCSCPRCNEGNSPNKRRCNILTQKYQWIQISCFNCGMSTNLRTFTQEFFPLLFQDYLREEKEEFIKNLKEGTLQQKEKKIETSLEHLDIKYKFRFNTDYFKPAKNFKKAIDFCKKRKIIDRIDELWYNVNKKSVHNGMIIFPFCLDDDRFYGFMGRHTEQKTFNVFSKNDSFKSYNVFQVDQKRPIIVTESIIDSMNIENSIAMVGADLTTGVKQFFEGSELIIAPDNDKTGLRKSVKYCEDKYKVFVWPDEIKTKDFNDLSVSGWSNEKVKKLILDNSYKGMELKTRLTFKGMKKGR